MRSVRNVLAVGLILATAWVVLPDEQRNRIRTIWDASINESATGSAEGRMAGFKAGIAMFLRYPILGVGPGCFIEYRVEHLDGVNLVSHKLDWSGAWRNWNYWSVCFSFVCLLQLW